MADTGKIVSLIKSIFGKELTDVKTAIQGITPNAQNSDIGKALILKTIDQTGKPTAFEYGEAGGGSVDPSVVEQKVEEWLEENITNPDSPPLDRSLSLSSAAAPADMLGVVDTELDISDYEQDLLATATYTQKKKLDGNGAIVDSNDYNKYEIYEIVCDGSFDKFSAKIYGNTNYQVKAIAFVNAGGSVISTLEYTSTSAASIYTDQTIPNGTTKIILCNRGLSGTDVSATKQSKKSQRLEGIESDISSIEDKISGLHVSTKNLFDESTQVTGLIYESSGILYPEYTTHRASDYIEVDANTIYTISAYLIGEGVLGINGLRFAFYKNDKTFISGYKPESEYSTFRTPANCKYIRFSMNAAEVEKFQLERRSFATKYIKRGQNVENDESDLMFMNFPAKCFAVTGLEYNYYLFNVRPEKNENDFNSRYSTASVTSFRRFGRFLRLVSENSAVGARHIKAEAQNQNKYGGKLFDIVVNNPSNLEAVSILVLGDSTTANGYVPQYLYEFGGENHLITPIGTLGTAPYKHEGRSGWRLSDYFTTAADNPFYNPSTGTFDAAYYFQQTGLDTPDVFIVNIGINDMHYDSGSVDKARIKAASFIEQMNAVIESVKGVDPSIKVAVCLTTPPNTDPYSFGAAATNIIDYDDYRIANLILCEKLIEEYDYRESEGIYLIPINACLDTKYNMPTETAYPNSRSTEQITVPTNAANVHPNQAGYHQIADEIYAFLCSL